LVKFGGDQLHELRFVDDGIGILVSEIMVDPTTIVSLGRPVPHFSGVDNGISCRARSGVGKKIAVTSDSCTFLSISGRRSRLERAVLEIHSLEDYRGGRTFEA
jgi:hypothetical protein